MARDEVEWMFPPEAGAAPDGAEDLARGAVRRARLVVVAAVFAVLLVAAGTFATRGTPEPGPAAASAPVAASSQPPDPMVQKIIAQADPSIPAVTYTLASSAGLCRGVGSGQSLSARLRGALREHLPGYRLRDESRIFGSDHGLCVHVARAVDAAGTVLVIRSTSSRPGTGPAQQPDDPGGGVFLLTGPQSGTAGSSAVIAAQLDAPDGWIVLVGVVGPIMDQPPFATLQSLAFDSDLRW